ncbi:MAG TPA: S8 family serine peptidase [Candidatus Deferrimicrobium sp.]|nr:S8 family serine peptidase [Candidatus Deferrimicrobium sp.]
MQTFRTIMTGVVVLCVARAGFGQHYYGGGRAIPLKVDTTKVTIKFDGGFGVNDQELLLASIDRVVAVVTDDHCIDGFIACSLSTGQNYGGFLDSVNAIDGVYLVEPYYRNELDSVFLVGTTFYVAFNDGVTQSQIDSINAQFKVVIDHAIESMPNAFALRNTDSSGLGLLDLANGYYELDETVFSHPLFGVWIRPQQYKLYDYYNSYQWHTKRVIGSFNSASVWDFAGLTRSVIVAVLDVGFMAHEDLPSSSMVQGFDYADGDSNYAPGIHPLASHGNGCTGIIAASHTTDSASGLHDSTGIISLDPHVKIMPVKIFRDNGSSTGITPEQLGNAIYWAWGNGAEVMSNSWGYGLTCPPGLDYDYLSGMIERATRDGRGGRGTPMIFAAGNGGGVIQGVLYPACLEASLAVGAIDIVDGPWYYSSYGWDLDIVAPSGDYCLQGDVWTLDLPGKYLANPSVTSNCGDPVTWSCPPGANDWDYDCNFGGTSAACPVAAGVAALLLAKDSTLTAHAVYDILRYSAETTLFWGSFTPPDIALGYGRVDAFRAVLSLAHGDLDNSNGLNVADLTFLVAYLFLGGAAPFPSVLLGDCDCDGDVDSADLTFLVAALFQGGPYPPKPCFAY